MSRSLHCDSLVANDRLGRLAEVYAKLLEESHGEPAHDLADEFARTHSFEPVPSTPAASAGEKRHSGEAHGDGIQEPFCRNPSAYSTWSLALASATVCHCRLLGASAPPRLSGMM